MTERQFQAHRLHQFRVEARLTIEDAAKTCGVSPERWFAIEYKGAGTVAQIKALIAKFEPGKRQLR